MRQNLTECPILRHFSKESVMRRLSGWVVGLWLSIGSLACADQPAGKLVEDIWDAAYLEGNKAGHVHTSTYELQRDGQKVLRTTTELDLKMLRFKDQIQLRMISGTEETATGKVVGVFMRQFLGKNQQLVINGKVEGRQLLYKVESGRNAREDRKPWDDQALGLYQQEHLFETRRVKPGDKLDYLSYEPTLNSVIKVRALVKDEEEVEVLNLKRVDTKTGRVARDKKRLLRIETTPDKFEAAGTTVQLPTMTLWLDRDMRQLRSQVEIQGLGKVVFLRASREIATSDDGKVATVADIGMNQLIRLNRRIPRAHDTKNVVYRITVKGDDDPGTAFARDDRQKIENVKGSSFDMRVRAIREPRSESASGQPRAEFLESNSFVNSDDARVRQHARAAVGTETDPWKKAARIERWVHNHIVNKNFTEALATADEVARTLEGDCTEHAVLTAAMCRAEGIPSRLAVGLVYVENRGVPSMGFHMWTEVWIKGQWLAIDSTLALGSIGAAHIKVFDHSWHDVSAVTTPLLAMTRVVGKVSIEVLSIDAD
jgi:hypothetical protein